MTESSTVRARSFGLGPLPGRDLEAAWRVVSSGGEPWHVPQLPERGLLAGATAQAAALAPDIGFEAGPRGLRLTARPQLATRRARDLGARDLDVLSVCAAGAPQLKLQVLGPWSLACELELSRGHRALTDGGAVTELAQQLAAGLRAYVTALSARIGCPPEKILVQLDEPWLAAVAVGEVPGTHQFDEIPPVDPQRRFEALDLVAAELPGEVLVNLAGTARAAREGLQYAWQTVEDVARAQRGRGGSATIIARPQTTSEFFDAVGASLDGGGRLALVGVTADDVFDLVGRLGLRDKVGLVDVVAAPPGLAETGSPGATVGATARLRAAAECYRAADKSARALH